MTRVVKSNRGLIAMGLVAALGVTACGSDGGKEPESPFPLEYGLRRVEDTPTLTSTPESTIALRSLDLTMEANGDFRQVTTYRLTSPAGHRDSVETLVWQYRVQGQQLILTYPEPDGAGDTADTLQWTPNGNEVIYLRRWDLADGSFAPRRVWLHRDYVGCTLTIAEPPPCT